MEPLVERVDFDIDLEKAFWRLSGRPHCLFLDSSLREQRLGRYSFLAVDPFDAPRMSRNLVEVRNGF